MFARVEQAMQRDRFRRGDEREERARDRLELAAHRPLDVDFEQRRRHLLLATRTDRGEEQRLLVGEVTVDGELGHAGLGRDRIHARAFEAGQRKQPLGGVEDGGALFEVFRSAGAARLGDGCVHVDEY